MKTVSFMWVYSTRGLRPSIVMYETFYMNGAVFYLEILWHLIEAYSLYSDWPGETYPSFSLHYSYLILFLQNYLVIL
jgi:Mor family transcriptional regulator